MDIVPRNNLGVLGEADAVLRLGLAPTVAGLGERTAALGALPDSCCTIEPSPIRVFNRTGRQRLWCPEYPRR